MAAELALDPLEELTSGALLLGPVPEKSPSEAMRS